MSELILYTQNVDQIVGSTGFPVLTHTGAVSHAQMESKTSALYLDFASVEKNKTRCMPTSKTART